MWSYIYEKFSKNPSQLRVVKHLISTGIRVLKNSDEGPLLFCNDIEIKPNTLARACKVDRRVVMSVTEKITGDLKLYEFFSDLKCTADLSRSSIKMGYGVIEISPESADKPGIVAGVSDIISKSGISIRQVIVDDPELVDDPKAVIVTDKKIPSELFADLKNVEGVRAITLL
ncbi:MAG: regulator [Thermoplasmata archaeon]